MQFLRKGKTIIKVSKKDFKKLQSFGWIETTLCNYILYKFGK